LRHFVFIILFFNLNSFFFTLLAQDSLVANIYFKQRNFGKPFIADRYAPIVKLAGGIGLNLDEYNINISRKSKYILYNESILGTELPIIQKSWKHKSLSLSIPVSFSVWFDFTEKRTSPILNTDYRFGALELNFLKTLKSNSIKNIGFKFIPFFHESTHIGDELTISRIHDSIPTARVNVSYEAMEFAVFINDPKNIIIKNNSIKVGSKFLLNPKKGWYTVSHIEADTTKFSPSIRWIEPYIHYQFQNPEGLLAGKNKMFVFSMALSFRVQYGYPIYYRDDQNNIIEKKNNETYKPSINILAGWRFHYSPLSTFGMYFRTYSGLNYHGQFRNIGKYQFFGISFIYEN